MRSKLKDVKLALSLQLNKKNRLEKNNIHKKSLRSEMREWRKSINCSKRKKQERNEKKIKLYKEHQDYTPVNKDQTRRKKATRPTVAP